jgi:hypothetical protein
LVGWIVARLARLRFPTLFLVAGALFLVNLVVPDVIPFVDEILLGLATALLASWRKTRSGEELPGPSSRGTPPI